MCCQNCDLYFHPVRSYDDFYNYQLDRTVKDNYFISIRTGSILSYVGHKSCNNIGQSTGNYTTTTANSRNHWIAWISIDNWAEFND